MIRVNIGGWQGIELVGCETEEVKGCGIGHINYLTSDLGSKHSSYKGGGQ